MGRWARLDESVENHVGWAGRKDRLVLHENARGSPTGLGAIGIIGERILQLLSKEGGGLMLASMSRDERVLQEIFGRRFSFKESQADLELLRSIHDGTYANTKTGDPSFHAHAAGVNAANEFASQALDILELIPFNNQFADLQEEYLPSYPPMSPVTSAFFASWLALDARDALTGLTLGADIRA